MVWVIFLGLVFAYNLVVGDLTKAVSRDGIVGNDMERVCAFNSFLGGVQQVLSYALAESAKFF